MLNTFEGIHCLKLKMFGFVSLSYCPVVSGQHCLSAANVGAISDV